MRPNRTSSLRWLAIRGLAGRLEGMSLADYSNFKVKMVREWAGNL